MRLTEDDLRGLWRQRAQPPGPDCLSEQDWSRHLTGETTAEERMRLAMHLSACGACADEYRALHALEPWADEAAAVLGGARLEHRPVRSWSWRDVVTLPRMALAASLVIIVALGAALVQMRADRLDERDQHDTRMAKADEALASATAALEGEREQRRRLESSGAAAEIEALRGALTALSKPQLDVPIVDLDPRGETRSATSREVPVIAVPRDARILTLILNFTPLAEDSTLRVAVSDGGGRAIWSTRTARTRGTASLNLTLARPEFPAGLYTIRLSRVDGTPVGDYHMRIRYAGEGMR
jgi:hypothetical protein